MGEGDYLSDLVRDLSLGDMPPSYVLGSERFPSLDQLVLEMKQYQIPRDRSMTNWLERFSRIGIMPLTIPSKDSLLVGICYQGKDGEERDAAEIILSLQDQFFQYNGYAEKKLEIALLDRVQFERVSKIVSDSIKGSYTTGKIKTTAFSRPMNRETFYGIMEQAIQNRVSDIHIEPMENKSTRVRFRVDGALSLADQNLNPDSHKQLVSMIKGVANLNITESRRPQDGRITFDEEVTSQHPALRGYNVRVSIAPMYDGEKIVMRISEEQLKSYGIENLRFPPDLNKKVKIMSESPDGLILVTGPTGSGKTTTLYSIIHHLNRDDINIVTIEEPVETIIRGVNQSPVNKSVDWDFHNVLKTYLRQDPDVILIGEIRDSETAKAAMEAAKTGHLVLSTLHTVDSVSSLTRLFELGAQSSDLQSSLNGVIAQRLARKICPSCISEYDAAQELNSLLNTEEFTQGPILHRGKGTVEGHSCSKCNGSGYNGRIVVPEVWVVGDEERDLIAEGCRTITKYQESATKNGLKPLAVAGFEAVMEGKTTLEELTGSIVRRSELIKRKEQLIRISSRIYS